jgi:hypothetical protein
MKLLGEWWDATVCQGEAFKIVVAKAPCSDKKIYLAQMSNSENITAEEKLALGLMNDEI